MAEKYCIPLKEKPERCGECMWWQSCCYMNKARCPIIPMPDTDKLQAVVDAAKEYFTNWCKSCNDTRWNGIKYECVNKFCKAYKIKAALAALEAKP